MNAKPNPGPREVGGATPYPGEALTDNGAANNGHPARCLPVRYPAEALVAALAWHANQAITGQVGLSYALADLARTHAQAVAKTVERSLPEGPLRSAITAATTMSIVYADRAAQAATRFGRHFGHLAFAFPQPAR